VISPEKVQELVGGHSLIRGIDRLPKGHLRIETVFKYPDGSSIEVFVPRDDDLFHSQKLTDMGQTMSLLLNMQVKPWMSKKRSAQLEDALRPYDISLNGAALEARVTRDEDLPDALIRLCQACLRVSDLLFTRRTALQTLFSEEVEELFVDAELPYDSNIERVGRYGKVIRIDYLVKGRRSESAVLTLSSAQTSQAHVTAVEIFRKWHDFAVPENREQRVTIFDDRVNVYRPDDLERLREYSTVFGLSEREGVIELLAA
jgi:hypothetical protein